MKLTLLAQLPGSSQSLLVQTESGTRWVVKPKDQLAHPYVCANEACASQLLRALGLPYLPWRMLHFDYELLLRTGGRRSFDQERFAQSSRFASRYQLDRHTYLLPLRMVPERKDWISAMIGIYVFDLWAAHVDRRELLIGVRRGRLHCSLLALDNSHLFFGPSTVLWQRVPLIPHPSREILLLSESRAMIADWIKRLRQVLPSAVSALPKQIPPEWGLNRLLQMPELFMQRLSDLEKLVAQEMQLLKGAT